MATRETCQDVVVGRQLTDGDVGCELVVGLDRGEHGVKLSGQVVDEKARCVFAGWLKCGVARQKNWVAKMHSCLTMAGWCLRLHQP